MSYIEQRKHQRIYIAIDVKLSSSSGAVSARTKNVSGGGALIEMPFATELFSLNGQVSISLAAIGTFAATVVHMSGNLLGVKFDNQIQAEKSITAYLERSGHI